MLDSPEEAEEVVQQVFAYVWEHHDVVDEATPSRAYLYRAAHNSALNRIRRHRVEQRWHDAEAVQEPETVAPSAGDEIEYQELAQAVQRAIERLPERCRLIYTMSRQEQMTYAEIATALDLSVKTVEAQMSRAFRLLRQMLRPLLSGALLIATGLGSGGGGA